MAREEQVEVWCMAKGSTNQKPDWTDCHLCCSSCNKTPGPCLKRPAKPCNIPEGGTCLWRASPSEWMLGNIDEKARRRIYQAHRVRRWESMGHREGDGTWEGNAIRHMRERYGKDFAR